MIEVEKMRRWTSPAWKERQPVLTENDDGRGKKAEERRDGRSRCHWARGALRARRRRGAAPRARRRVCERPPACESQVGAGAARSAGSRRKTGSGQRGAVECYFIGWELALARHGPRGGKNARHSFVVKMYGERGSW